MRTILKPSWIVDGTGAAPLTAHVVVVDGDRIDAVQLAAQVQARPDDRVIDLTGATLLPGLINHHVHLVLPGDNTPFVPWIDTQTDPAITLRAAANSAASLRAGITTVRDCGARGTTVLDLRNAQAAGLAGGARVVSCGWPLTITGGHTHHFGGEADGVDGLRRMVRRVVSLGADYVKVMASGGGTPGSVPQAPSFSPVELTAIVETAHDLGRTVTMHCIATESIERAIDAGADFIEHAMFFDRDLEPRYDPRIAERLAESGITVTPTLQVNRDLVDLLPEDAERDQWLIRQESHRTMTARLHELGVPLLAGSDAGWRATAFDTFWKELDELVVCGLTPVEAIRAATGAAAAALGADGRYGTIEPGATANLLAVEGNAAADIRCLAQVRAVFAAGLAVTR
jgi:imidazolonepropionase-like amidohydrolase